MADQKRVPMHVKQAIAVTKLNAQLLGLQEEFKAKQAQLQQVLLKQIGEYDRDNPDELTGFEFIGFDDETGELIFQAKEDLPEVPMSEVEVI